MGFLLVLVVNVQDVIVAGCPPETDLNNGIA
jgi:hypothetical protein